MDPQLVQRTRYVLRSRVRRTQTCPLPLFPSACKHLVDWLTNHPIFSSLVIELERRSGELGILMSQAVSNLASNVDDGTTSIGSYSAGTTGEHAVICWSMVKAVAAAGETNEWQARKLYNKLYEFINGEDEFVEIEKGVELIRDVAVEGLYEYLDERLDSRSIIYSLLLKYKQRSEWFHGSRLRRVADEGLEGKKGERGLAVDLQEYVFDQQVEFVIEPVSHSGETDLVLKDPEAGHLILDAKYVPEGASRSEILKKLSDGFHQVYRYCEDFNEPEGFLVVFVRSTKRIAPELEESDGHRFLKLAGKTIYYMEVHMSEEPSASKSGQAEEIHITHAELVRSGD